jgi:uncharacterized protein (TIGR02118 family)
MNLTIPDTIKETGMITRFGMAPRRAGLTTAQFVEHWRTSHADAAGKIPNLRSYVQLHPVLIDGRLPLPYTHFDACSMLDFDDVASMDAGFASPTYQGEVREDEDKFIDKSRFSMFLSERRVLEPLPEDGVVLATYVRRHPAASSEEFLEAFTGPWAATAGGRGREQFLPYGERTGRERHAADAIDLRGFDTAEDALEWLTAEDGGVLADLELAGPAFGTERLLARPYRVL